MTNPTDNQTREKFHDSQALYDMHKAIMEHTNLLSTAYTRLEDEFLGKLRYQHQVQLDIIDDEGGTEYLFKNRIEGGELRDHDIPVGEVWPWPFSQCRPPSFKVSYNARDVQPEAEEAERVLNKTKHTFDELQKMNSKDMEVLSELPLNLATVFGTTQDAKLYFKDGQGALADRVTRVLNPLDEDVNWTGDARDTYADMVNAQGHWFSVCHSNLETLETAILQVIDAIIIVLNALAEAYKARIQEGVELVNDAISFSKSATDWTYWAGKLLKHIENMEIKQAEDFKKLVRNAGNSFYVESMKKELEGTRIPDGQWKLPYG